MPCKAVQNAPTVSPDRALKALTQQLDGLQKLKGRRYEEAEADETEWQHLTQSLIEAAFGDHSSSLSKFHTANWAGEHYAGGMSPQQHQVNFELRVREYDALLRSLIGVLRLQLPEEEIKGVYEPGEQYAFYRDLSSLIVTATRDIFIVRTSTSKCLTCTSIRFPTARRSASSPTK